MSEANKCDVCRRLRVTSEELEPFDGETITNIEAIIGKRCWMRGSGPCVNLGWARVRALKELIQKAIDARPRS